MIGAHDFFFDIFVKEFFYAIRISIVYVGKEDRMLPHAIDMFRLRTY